MPDEAEIKSAIIKVIKGANGDAPDDDTLEYYVGVVADDDAEKGNVDELYELIGVWLADAAGVGDDEDAGKALCGKLFEALWPKGAAAAKTFVPPARGPSVAKVAVNMAEFGAEASRQEQLHQFGEGTYEGVQQTLDSVARVSKKKKEKQGRSTERKAWRAHVKCEDDSVWVDDIPDGASLAGDGAGTCTCHLVNFNLANKKGSGDLLMDATVTLAAGRRYGLIGKNGVGKSTFLDALAKREIPGVPACSIFYVRQEVTGDERTALQWVLEADSERMKLAKEIEDLEKSNDKEAGTKLARLYERLEDKNAADGGNAEKRARDILRGLGLEEDMAGRPTNRLSGGWRMRVALACALFVSPGLLLLDEPTNHLDLETVIWLERHLRDVFQQTLLVVSHDRHFLNEVVTDILHFEKGKIESYKGDYYSFEGTVEERRARQERLREVQEEKKAHMQEYITKHGQLGSNGPSAAAQRKSRMKKMERVGMEAAAAIEGRKIKSSYDGVQEEVDAVQDEKAFTLSFPDPGSTGRDVPCVRLDGVTFAYGENAPLFENATWSFDVRSRVAVLGRNGCGKSTLIKVILGQLEPSKGAVVKDPGCKIEYVAQHHLDVLDPDASPLEFALRKYPEDESFSHEQRMRSHLATFGLGGTVLPFQPIRTLSGGQKCRLSMALVMYRRPHFLIVDEPTNHLDMETADALADAINQYKGGVLIVSHDQHLINKVCKEILVVRAKRVKKFDGSVDAYRQKVVSGAW
eukprot:TRINITY_DN9228_c0_g3_i1.p1 TRINITY_DN9228_c0_g3~~TRINITY_DN9228_c0_g3_i1.p1  ORF type:complete len:749 (-),score=199.30 TRINITY_DN9228_c0_g3_i1:269-2515(-)